MINIINFSILKIMFKIQNLKKYTYKLFYLFFEIIINFK